jgi:hypothetical protein
MTSAGSASRFRASAAVPPRRGRLEGRPAGRHRGRPASEGTSRPGRHRCVQDDAPREIIQAAGEAGPC